MKYVLGDVVVDVDRWSEAVLYGSREASGRAIDQYGQDLFEELAKFRRKLKRMYIRRLTERGYKPLEDGRPSDGAQVG